jgi:hypothetical protein
MLRLVFCFVISRWEGGQKDEFSFRRGLGQAHSPGHFRRFFFGSNVSLMGVERDGENTAIKAYPVAFWSPIDGSHVFFFFFFWKTRQNCECEEEGILPR